MSAKRKILEVIKKSEDARVIYRANALNLRHKGLSAIEVADFLEITSRTVFNIESNYEILGLDRALYDDPGTPIKFDDRIKGQIIAVVCSDPPEGFDRWTLELIQERSVKDKIVKGISLEEHDIKPWRETDPTLRRCEAPVRYRSRRNKKS